VKILARLPLMAAVLGATVVGVAGCNTSPGAAALVGSQRISAQTLQDTVNRALADPAAQQQVGQNRADFVRSELSRLITNVVVAKAAADNGVSVSNADIETELRNLAQQAGGQAQLVQAASAAGIPEQDLRNFVRFFVMQQKLGAKLASGVNVSDAQLQSEYNKNLDKYDQVDAAHILLKTKAQAEKVLAQVRSNPALFPVLAARLSLDTGSKANGGDLGFQPHSQFVKPFADAIFAAKPGSIFVVHTQFGWHVVHVLAHRKTSLAEATPELKASLLQPQQKALLQQELEKVARQLGIHVSPRYGHWDYKQDKVVATPGGSDLSSPAPSSAT
jgi:parvulin-like peptidyl-prolyl isomerase